MSACSILCCDTASDPKTAPETEERVLSLALQSLAELVTRNCAEFVGPFMFCLGSLRRQCGRLFWTWQSRLGRVETSNLWTRFWP